MEVSESPKMRKEEKEEKLRDTGRPTLNFPLQVTIQKAQSLHPPLGITPSPAVTIDIGAAFRSWGAPCPPLAPPWVSLALLGAGTGKKPPPSSPSPRPQPPFRRQLTESGLSYVRRAGVFTGYQNSTGKAVQTAGSYESEGYGEDTAQGRTPKDFCPLYNNLCSTEGKKGTGRGGSNAAPPLCAPTPPGVQSEN